MRPKPPGSSTSSRNTSASRMRLAVFGLVDNGSREHAVDWALFSVGYLAWAPPRPARSGAPGHANLSFKSLDLRRHADRRVTRLAGVPLRHGCCVKPATEWWAPTERW